MQEEGKPDEENVAKQKTSWCPGRAIPDGEDAKEILTPLVAGSPTPEKIMDVLLEAHESKQSLAQDLAFSDSRSDTAAIPTTT